MFHLVRRWLAVKRAFHSFFFLNFILLVALLLGGLILAACSDNATPTAANPASSAAATAGPTKTPAATASPAASPATTVTPEPTTTPLPGMAGIPVISAEQNTAKPFTQDWKASLADAAEPTIVGEIDGMVIVKSRQGGLYAFDLKTGTLAWKQVPNTAPSSVAGVIPTAAIAPGVAIVGDVAAEKVTAYDTKTGQKKWEHNLKFTAPNRDAGSRFLGNKVYGLTYVVAVSSKVDPNNPQAQTSNPEYVLLVGMDINTGKDVWNIMTDPADPKVGSRIASVVYASKNVLVENPDLSLSAFDGATGKSLWRGLNTFLLRTPNPDQLFSVVPEGGQKHLPRLRKLDINTGNLVWEKLLPTEVLNDPLIAISPDEHSAYVSVLVSAQETYVYRVDLDKNTSAWRFNTQTFGDYTLTATNDGVRLRSYGKQSGIVFLNRDVPDPVVWAVGGIETLDDVATADGLYLTARNNQEGLLYLVGLDKGDIKLATKTLLPGQEPVIGANQVYIIGLDSNGKPALSAYARPQK
ncbi:MAG TPA: PQQ-binding-like beta-propeller repeat protein [Chloroflexia bacterium]|nr:PQQ-binding-like beta-propeller repeat protein [Chloroflexia bacterium]